MVMVREASDASVTLKLAGLASGALVRDYNGSDSMDSWGFMGDEHMSVL